MRRFVIGAVAAALAGCGDGGARACTPGYQMACVCSTSGLGTQVCNADGTGFDACSGCPPPTIDGGMCDFSSTNDNGFLLTDGFSDLPPIDFAWPDIAMTPDFGNPGDGDNLGDGGALGDGGDPGDLWLGD